MPSSHWEQVDRVFCALLDAGLSSRQGVLAQLRVRAPGLEREVEELLQAHERAGTFLEVPACEDESWLALPEPGAACEGRRIGEYVIRRVLGAGGMGIVYEAEQASPRRSVALKVIRGGPLVDEHQLLYFQREEEALARLQHPAIASIYHSGCTSDGQHYFVMELVRGVPLDEYVKRRDPSLREKLELVIQVAGAIAYAHRRGVIHRDLKPSNILVVDEAPSDGARPAVKVLDFGLARIVESDLALAAKASRSGDVRGTLAYMSPEQARGSQAEIDVRSDVYSLGVVLYELATGQPPYQLQDRFLPDALRIICDEPPLPPSRLRRELRGDVETILLKALEKESERRYASAADLAADLRRFLAGDPIAARSASTWYVLRRTLARHKVAAAVAALIFALVTASAVGLGLLYRTAQDERDTARTETEKAERRFDDLHRLSSAFLEVEMLIQGLPGATAARQFLARTGTAYLDDLAREAAEDRGLLREVADGYEKIGDTLGNPHGANLGDTEGALESYQKALGIRERLGREDPQDTAGGLALAQSHAGIADLAAQRGAIDDAFAGYRRAAEVCGALAAAHPEDVWVREGLAIHLERLAGLHEFKGEKEEALRLFQEALGMTEALQRERPEVAKFQSLVTLSRLQTGEALAAAGAVEKGLEVLGRARSDAKKRRAAEPESAGVRRDLALVLSATARVLDRAGRPAEALSPYREAREIHRERVAADPKDMQARKDLAATRDQVASLLERSGAAAEALSELLAACEDFEKLREADPANRQVRNQLASAFSRAAVLQQQQGQLREALETCARAIALREEVLQADPTDRQTRAYRSVDYSTEASVHVAMGEREKARRSLELSVEDLRSNADSAPEDSQARWYLANGHWNLAVFHARGKEREEAIAELKLAARAYQGVCQQVPGHHVARRSLLRAQQWIGGFSRETGRIPEALEAWSQALAQLDLLVAGGEKVSADTLERARTRGDYAMLIGSTGRFEESLKEMRLLVSDYEAVAAAEPSNAEARKEIEDWSARIRGLEDELKKPAREP